LVLLLLPAGFAFGPDLAVEEPAGDLLMAATGDELALLLSQFRQLGCIKSPVLRIHLSR
jgi:hypothetical protein